MPPGEGASAVFDCGRRGRAVRVVAGFGVDDVAAILAVYGSQIAMSAVTVLLLAIRDSALGRLGRPLLWAYGAVFLPVPAWKSMAIAAWPRAQILAEFVAKYF